MRAFRDLSFSRKLSVLLATTSAAALALVFVGTWVWRTFLNEAPPAPIAYSSAALLWRLYGVGIGVSLDYLRYLWLVDDERARALLGFAPRWDVRGIVQEYARGPGSPEG